MLTKNNVFRLLHTVKISNLRIIEDLPKPITSKVLDENGISRSTIFTYRKIGLVKMSSVELTSDGFRLLLLSDTVNNLVDDFNT